MKVTEQEVKRFKELDSKVKAGTATKEEFAEAKKLASLIKRGLGRGSKERKSGTNDIDWYSKYPDLLKDAANVIFNEIAGTEFKFPVKGTANDNIKYPVVGMRVNILPTIGKCFEANHPFNYQMRDLWLKLHRAYRGVGTYEYADLGIAIFAIMMAFGDIARAERIYALSSKFVRRNRSFPSVVLSALGLDPSAMSAEELADFRYKLNRCIRKAGNLCLPKGFSAFELYIRLFGNIFKDSDNVRAQWFVYDSIYRLDYDPTSMPTGGSIAYTARTATGSGGTQTLDDIISDINTQLDNLLSDTDIARICSDILKAFGDNEVQTLLPVPEEFDIDVVVDPVRKLQLHNTVFNGNVAGGGFSSSIFTAMGSFTKIEDTLRIYQENGVVHQRLFTIDGTAVTPTVTPSSYHADAIGEKVPAAGTGVGNQFNFGALGLNCWMEDPTGNDVVEMTRQTVGHNLSTVVDSGTTYEIVELDNYSIYVVTHVAFYTANPGSYQFGMYGSNYLVYNSAVSGALAAILGGHLSRLDWAPRFSLIYAPSGTPVSEAQFWDLDNYSLISKESLSRIHDACVLSLFKLELSVRSNN